MIRNDWRESDETPGYEVTSDGRVKRTKTGNILPSLVYALAESKIHTMAYISKYLSKVGENSKWIVTITL